jgi:hypothetical protein
MMTQKSPKRTRLPGILPTLKAGFELTGRHWWLVLLPALLDTFYWLGPRLSPRHLVEQTVNTLTVQPFFAGMNEQLIAAAQQTNLFTSLTVPFLGVPALMRLTPSETPLSPSIIEVQSLGMWFLLFLGLTVIGVLLTALYFSLVARAVKRGSSRLSLKQFIRRVLRTWGQLTVIGLGLAVAALIIFFPLMIIGYILSLISAQLFFLVLLIGMMLLFWIAVFCGFAPHGLTLNGRSLFQAINESVQLVRLNYISTMLLLLAISGISTLMDYLLRFADDGSWLTISSILGHAFVSTSLVAATYVFYQDRVTIQLIAQRQSLPIDPIEETSNGR